MRVVYAIGGFLLVATVAAVSTSVKATSCDRSYPDFCIPPPPPDLDCPDVRGKKPFRVRRPDPHHFDRDRDGWACEPPRRR
jgi:micrococcal nuclease